MSSRELEVLALVLKGFGTPQIATALDIAESTAHDHVKRMMLKTRARNRVELAAKTSRLARRLAPQQPAREPSRPACSKHRKSASRSAARHGRDGTA